MTWHEITTNATVGNVGPGFDSFGLCLDKPFDKYSVRLIDDSKSKILAVTGVDAEKVPLTPDKNCAIIAAESLLNHFKVPQKIEMKIHRGIPIAGGLGSSAAASVGGALAAATAIKKQTDNAAILCAALVGESQVAGHHLDNIAPCLLGGLTVVLENNPPLVHKFQVPVDQWVIVIVKPPIEIRTADARKVLPKESKMQDWVRYLSYSAATLQHLLSGDAERLQESFVDHFAAPKRKSLIPDYDKIAALAHYHKSCGFCISGAGPTMLAIFSSNNFAQNFSHDIAKSFPNYYLQICRIDNDGAR